MAPDKDIKLYFDTPTEEETISPDKKCFICHSTGKMKIANTSPPGKFTYSEKECVCIRRQRVELTASKRLSNIFKDR